VPALVALPYCLWFVDWFLHISQFVLQLDCIGKALLDICLATPGGVVCFLPSYDYEAIFYRWLDQSGLLSRLAAVKKVSVI